MESSIQVTRPCRLQEMENVEEWKEINWEVVGRHIHEDKLPIIISRIPKRLWHTRSKSNLSLLDFSCTKGDEVSTIKLLATCQDFNTNLYLSRYASIVTPYQPRLLQLFIACGFNGHFPGTDSTFSYIWSFAYINGVLHWPSMISRCESCLHLLISNGVRLKNEEKHVKVEKFRIFQEGVICCRDVLIVLLGLKKRQHVLLKRLDRFLIKQVLAVEIWATRCNDNWQN